MTFQNCWSRLNQDTLPAPISMKVAKTFLRPGIILENIFHRQFHTYTCKLCQLRLGWWTWRPKSSKTFCQLSLQLWAWIRSGKALYRIGTTHYFRYRCAFLQRSRPFFMAVVISELNEAVFVTQELLWRLVPSNY